MEWTLLTQEQYVTSQWSGGTTTQLAIGPEGAVYADRDFLWRLSSAGVELEHSEFTPLPDYNRHIALLRGELELKIGGEERFSLAPLAVRAFDGGAPVESWGRCTDFNLMTRKGQCRGGLESISLSAGGVHSWDIARSGQDGACTLALYCVSGEVSLAPEGPSARAGQLLLCREAECGPPIRLESRGGCTLMASAIWYE